VFRAAIDLAATDEKDLSTAQPPTKTDAWISRPDGDARRTQRAQAAQKERSAATGDFDSRQAARLASLRPFGFRAADRLHRRREFLRAQRRGARIQSAHFVIYASRLPQNYQARLGTTVSRRIGGAVVRNRVKRRVRECFRLKLRPILPAGTDLLVIARTGSGQLASAEIFTELLHATMKLQRLA
jgi:ribonuclease P protein component